MKNSYIKAFGKQRSKFYVIEKIRKTLKSVYFLKLFFVSYLKILVTYNDNLLNVILTLKVRNRIQKVLTKLRKCFNKDDKTYIPKYSWFYLSESYYFRKTMLTHKNNQKYEYMQHF